METLKSYLTVLFICAIVFIISTIVIWSLFNWIIPLIYTLPFTVGWKESAIIAVIIVLVRSIL